MVLSERQGECVGFVGVERHNLSVEPVPDSVKVCREGRGCCLPVSKMRNDMAEGGIIIKDKQVFPGN